MEERDELTHRAVEKYITITKIYHHYLDRELKKTGLSRSQHQLLMFVARRPGSSQREIAAGQRISTASVAVTVKKLEEGGYVARSADKSDARYSRLQITPKGMAVVEDSVKLFNHTKEALFSGFGSGEIQQFEAFLDRLKRNGEELIQK